MRKMRTEFKARDLKEKRTNSASEKEKKELIKEIVSEIIKKSVREISNSEKGGLGKASCPQGGGGLTTNGKVGQKGEAGVWILSPPSHPVLD